MTLLHLKKEEKRKKDNQQQEGVIEILCFHNQV